jgi:hypothetical protein
LNAAFAMAILDLFYFGDFVHNNSEIKKECYTFTRFLVSVEPKIHGISNSAFVI